MPRRKASNIETVPKVDNRTRNWRILVYPESAPENWRDVIDDTHIEWVESPLHDKDVEDDGTVKKAHWHITLLYPGKKSFEQIKELTDKLHAPIPQKCDCVKGSIRYMVHKDHPEKAQYNWSDIKCHGGADLDALCAPTHSERLIILKDMVRFIKINHITEFQTMAEYTSENNSEWFSVMMNYSTLSIQACISSNRYRPRPRKTTGSKNADKGEDNPVDVSEWQEDVDGAVDVEGVSGA